MTRMKAKKTQARTDKTDQASNFLSNRIRDLRRTRQWSLADLSQRSGIATSTLSKVENNTLSLNYDRLLMIARAFGMSLPEFLAGPAPEQKPGLPMARFSIARRNSGRVLDSPNYVYEYLCTNLKMKKMVPLLSRIKTRSLEEFGPPLHHDGEEFTFVIKGRVTIHTDVYEPETLEEGEGVYIDSQMGHAYVNSGDGEAWILSVNCNPVA